jgi:hypothetical protein
MCDWLDGWYKCAESNLKHLSLGDVSFKSASNSWFSATTTAAAGAVAAALPATTGSDMKEKTHTGAATAAATGAGTASKTTTANSTQIAVCNTSTQTKQSVIAVEQPLPRALYAWYGACRMIIDSTAEGDIKGSKRSFTALKWITADDYELDGPDLVRSVRFI